MRRAKIHHSVTEGLPSDLAAGTSVTLAYDDRHRRRIRMMDDHGEEFLLDLAQATYLQDGDLLELEDGQAITVKAAEEDILEVTCKSIEQAACVAWHIGNRHTPVEVLETGVMRLRYDHVLQHMLEGLGASCERKTGAFAPEPGAYASGGHGGGHSHAH